MTDDFYNKYPTAIRDKLEFSVSRAIMSMLENNLELHTLLRGDFDLAANFVTSAWNLATINDRIIISLLIKPVAKELKSQSRKTQKQVEKILCALIALKNKLYPDIYRYINDYSSAPDANGKPYLKVVSTANMDSDYFANKYRKILFGNQKYGWVKNSITITE